MKTLFLLRHAKSDWGDSGLDDHDRPLTPRGVRASARIGRWLAEQEPTPELVLCSSAQRAGETLAGILPCLPDEPVVRSERALYLASPQGLLERTQTVAEEVASLMLVGHNPGMHALAAGLSVAGQPDALQRLTRKFPTAALAVLRFPVERWCDLDAERGELVHFVTPRSLEG